jgi:hypothetical protein
VPGAGLPDDVLTRVADIRDPSGLPVLLARVDDGVAGQRTGRWKEEITPSAIPGEPPPTADVAQLLDGVLPLAEGRRWTAHGFGDNVIVSRFDLSLPGGQSEPAFGLPNTPRSHATALLDLPASFGGPDLYMICAHFQSREGVAARQEQADAIVNWIGDLRTPGGEADIPARTPIVVLGDFNAYKTDPAHHMTTLLTGRIVNRARFGDWLAPDWDGRPGRAAPGPRRAAEAVSAA